MIPDPDLPAREPAEAASATRCVRTRFRLTVSALFVGTISIFAAGACAQSCPASLNHVVPRLQDEAPQDLCQYVGRVVLVVNTASFCGFTGQYEQLEALHARYAARGLTVLGFPSNDFGQQEPGSKEDIAALCFNTYGVRFPMFTKIAVIGAGAHPLYAELAKASGQTPRWNFHKYLLDRTGRVVGSYPSQVSPLDTRITQRIDDLLGNRGESMPKTTGSKG